MQLIHPSIGAMIPTAHPYRQYLPPFTSCDPPLPKSPMVNEWQIGAHTVQQHPWQ